MVLPGARCVGSPFAEEVDVPTKRPTAAVASDAERRRPDSPPRRSRGAQPMRERRRAVTGSERGLRIAVTTVGLLLLAPGFALAQSGRCESRFDDGLQRFDWVAITHSRYVLCHAPGRAEDGAFVRRWLNRTLRVARLKYGVRRPLDHSGRRLSIVVFLPPQPTTYTRRGLITNLCCDREGETDALAEIHYLTPSAWGRPPYGGLRYESGLHYHSHYVMHEMMNLLHYAVPGDRNIPSWIREGLAEYDGFFHTTAWNRTEAVDRLVRYVDTREREKIHCCQTLAGPRLGTSSTYYGSAVILMFLAETFGEASHSRLFEMSLRDYLRGQGWNVNRAFRELQAWFDEQVASRDVGHAASYTPSVACTGRYWRRDDGRMSFEVQIRNNAQRPSGRELFRQQYRRDASRQWATSGENSLIPMESNTSGFSTPLFTGPSSPPFQWRAQSCDRAGGVCSGWSNVINWTAARCAAQEVILD